MLNNHQYKKKTLLWVFNEWKLYGQKAARVAEHSTKRGGLGGWLVNPQPPAPPSMKKLWSKRLNFSCCEIRRPLKMKIPHFFFPLFYLFARNEDPWKRRPKIQDSQTQIREQRPENEDSFFFFPLFFFATIVVHSRLGDNLSSLFGQ